MKRKISILFLIALLITATMAVLMKDANIQVLNPQGTIAEKQRDLLLFTTILSLVVILPVFILTAYIPWKFRAGNKQARYTPEWADSKKLELLWWGIPLLIIIVLAVITWVTTHSLDPYRPLDSKTKPVTVQVVALQWKWLFLYPEQGVATVNYLQVPENTPINFELTADSPMNSFWIPQLGGQVYTMSGMTTKLHLDAHEPGSYIGQSANISGEGFADMKFVTKVTSRADFDDWLSSVQASGKTLSYDAYRELAKPAVQMEPLSYAAFETNLFDTILHTYMSNHQMESVPAVTHSKMEDTHHD